MKAQYLSCFGRGLDEGDTIGPGQFLGLLCVHSACREVTFVSDQHHRDVVWVLHAFNLFSADCKINKGNFCTTCWTLKLLLLKQQQQQLYWEPSTKGALGPWGRAGLLLEPGCAALLKEGGEKGGTTQPANSITSSLQQPGRTEWWEEWVIQDQWFFLPSNSTLQHIQPGQQQLLNRETVSSSLHFLCCPKMFSCVVISEQRSQQLKHANIQSKH